MLRVPAVPPLLPAGPDPTPQPTVPDTAIRESILDPVLSDAILDLTPRIEDLEAETRDGAHLGDVNGLRRIRPSSKCSAFITRPKYLN